MKPAIPPHQRLNYERTDRALTEIRGLFHALDIMRDVNSEPAACSDHSLAVSVVFDLMAERIEGLDRLRAMEWCGIGGQSEILTADEIATARGEVRS